MCTDRREFLRLSTAAIGLAATSPQDFEAAPESSFEAGGNSTATSQASNNKVVPISDDERRARIAKAQRLMVENKIDAIYLESGSSLFYYTGMRWGNSERMFAAVIPARGEIAWITPKFEEARARELIRFGKGHTGVGRRRKPV